jgi:hypothetical protein
VIELSLIDVRNTTKLGNTRPRAVVVVIDGEHAIGFHDAKNEPD